MTEIGQQIEQERNNEMLIREYLSPEGEFGKWFASLDAQMQVAALNLINNLPRKDTPNPERTEQTEIPNEINQKYLQYLNYLKGEDTNKPRELIFMESDSIDSSGGINKVTLNTSTRGQAAFIGFTLNGQCFCYPNTKLGFSTSRLGGLFPKLNINTYERTPQNISPVVGNKIQNSQGEQYFFEVKF